jgi:hypothetical protein
MSLLVGVADIEAPFSFAGRRTRDDFFSCTLPL